MPTRKIRSIRALAHELGISHTTVSDALRNNPRVSLKTRQRVQKAAQELGYKYNPFAGAIMSEIRNEIDRCILMLQKLWIIGMLQNHEC